MIITFKEKALDCKDCDYYSKDEKQCSFSDVFEYNSDVLLEVCPKYNGEWGEEFI